MSKIYEQVCRAGDLVGRIMDREGTLTEEDEEVMEEVLEDSEDAIGFLRAYFARTVQEERNWKEELTRFSDLARSRVNRAQSQQAWAKMRALELLQAREALGEGTVVKNVAHIQTSYSLNGPEDIADWPEEYRSTKETVRPDKKQALKDIKAGKEIAGFSLRTNRTVVFK